MNTLLVNGLPSSSMCCRAEREESRRVEGGRTSSTSQEQWSVFSWITFASSSLLSHWFTLLHHSPTQEAVTNRNDKSSKLAANIPRWLIFKVTFVSEINVLTCWHKKHIIWGCKKKKLLKNESRSVYVIMTQWPKWRDLINNEPRWHIICHIQ